VEFASSTVHIFLFFYVIQLVCRSDGEPKPRNEWAVIGIDGVKLTNEQSIKGYSFIIVICSP
jgi:hypothetical protein